MLKWQCFIIQIRILQKELEKKILMAYLKELEKFKLEKINF